LTSFITQICHSWPINVVTHSWAARIRELLRYLVIRDIACLFEFHSILLNIHVYNFYFNISKNLFSNYVAEYSVYVRFIFEYRGNIIHVLHANMQTQYYCVGCSINTTDIPVVKLDVTDFPVVRVHVELEFGSINCVRHCPQT
jgi:hypothetical protein